LKQIAQLLPYLALLATISLGSCLKQEAKKNSAGGQAPFNSETTPVKWSTSSLTGGLDVRISSDLTNSFVAADLDASDHNPIEQMFKQWNSASDSITFFKVNAQTTANKDYGNLDSYRNDGELGIYRSDSWIPGVSNQALAVTQYVGFRRNAGTVNEHVELTHADIIINFKDYSFSTDSSSTTTYDLHSVILHELGHFIGLKHVSSFSTSSVMQPYLGIFDNQRTITSYDSTTVQSLYGLSSLRPSGIVVSAASVPTRKVLPKGTRVGSNGEITGLIELRADGNCRHYENGKLVHSH
jgi:hypothetical protein